MSSDAELVRATLDGQLSAYDQLVQRWTARLLGYVGQKVGNDHEAEDLTQEAFLKAYLALDNLNEPKKFGSWLLAIAHRLILDWSKRNRGRTTSLNGNQFDWICSATPNACPDAEIADNRERQQKLKSHIDDLPDNLRDVLVVYYFDKMTYQDAATVLDVSVATINARLTKARTLLRNRMAVSEGGQS